MKKYLATYRPFIRFLLVFFVSYGALSFMYNLYLAQYENLEYPVDSFTVLLSDQIKYVSDVIGVDISIDKIVGEQWTRLVYKNHAVARIVEGCNAISVMILFVSFVMAFARKVVPTIVFSMAGILMIHILNIFRIIIIGMLIYYYPQHIHLTHGVLFPLAIYGFVFVLWILWVKKFSGFITTSTGQEDEKR